MNQEYKLAIAAAVVEALEKLELKSEAKEKDFMDFRGWRFFEPFICMGCGLPTSARQWAFSRSCGSCDISNSRTRRLLIGRCFAGKREKLPDWNGEKGDIPDHHFVDPKDRENYPVIFKEKRINHPPYPRPKRMRNMHFR